VSVGKAPRKNHLDEDAFSSPRHRATGAWDRANDRLSEVADSEVVDAIADRYPESFFAKSEYF
jgi:hypothetical protein